MTAWCLQRFLGLVVSALTSRVDIAVMSWAVANGLPRVKLLGTPFDGHSAEP